MEEILPLCRERGVKVVEDAAQSLGAAWKGRQTGTLGDAGCYSFYPTKPLGGFGDGGLVAAGLFGAAAISSGLLARRLRRPG